MDIQIKGEDFGSGHRTEKPKPTERWECGCPKEQPPYLKNCPDCWERRPY